MLLDNIKIFLDTADIFLIKKYNNDIAGVTTNPTLMKEAGILDYKRFAQDVIEVLGERPISLEIVTDDFDEMKVQARILVSWGDNVFVKIPTTNTKGESSKETIETLVAEGIKVNVTAICTWYQTITAMKAIGDGMGFVSIFAGRMMDTGINPSKIISFAVEKMNRYHKKQQVIWASTREVYNIQNAMDSNCDIITISPALLNKAQNLWGKDLDDYSLETVKMFLSDAKNAQYKIE